MLDDSSLLYFMEVNQMAKKCIEYHLTVEIE